MEFMGLWFIVIAVMAVLIITLAIVKSVKDKKAFSLWARARRWEFMDTWRPMVRVFSGGPFGRGSSRAAKLGFMGTFDGLPAGGFRYQYSTGSGDDRTTHHFQVLFIRVNGATFPGLTLGRENWGTRTFSKDIEFEDAAFNDQWHVRGESPRFAHDVIHPRMMEFLKGPEVPRLQSLWFERDHIVFARSGHLPPEAIDAHLRFMTRMASLIPSFVLAEVGAGRLELTWDGPGLSAEEQAARLAQLQQGDS